MFKYYTLGFVFLFFSNQLFANPINVRSASYGKNCGVRSGNVTGYVKTTCDGRSSCSYYVNHKKIGDPAYGCRKDFTVKYNCGVKSRLKTQRISGEASGKKIHLNCGKKLKVLSATYGKNCGVRNGNVTHYLRSSCNNKASCSYRINHKKIGDPAYGCKKDFMVKWQCTNGQVKKTFLAPEASGKSLILKCN